ncbi:hypothetical protein M378DRAFT_167585 [Amanita muscaria Koide BX008]|uniref:Uncharacterized protein n=1 Tax=Amanita muscaria (strain Koide BX008) TaxID=946122 RepID=A0A0C2WHE2_AMAMK|nr:hypothetical protein M378DRAFT_167585 [Amanita muscaria Koide BX008]
MGTLSHVEMTVASSYFLHENRPSCLVMQRTHVAAAINSSPKFADDAALDDVGHHNKREKNQNWSSWFHGEQMNDFTRQLGNFS